MQKVKQLIENFRYSDLYTSYGFANIIHDLHKIKKDNNLFILDDNEFLEYEVSFDDLCEVVNYYKNRTNYIVTEIKEGVTYFDFAPATKDNVQDKGGHILSSYKGFGNTLASIESFLNSKGKDVELTKSMSVSNTKNVNPFSAMYQRYDMYVIASNIVTTITTQKFNELMSCYLPEFENFESYLYYFKYVMDLHNNRTYLNNKGKEKRSGVLRPNHHFKNFDEKITWYIKDKDMKELSYINSTLHIAETISNVNNLSNKFNVFKEDIKNATWYKYGDTIQTFKIDYLANSVIYNHYKNVNVYLDDFKYAKNDNNRFKKYVALINFLKNCNSHNMYNILNLDVEFKESNKFINNYKNKLKMKNSELVEKLAKNVNKNIYFVYKERYGTDKEMLNKKVSVMKSEVARKLKKANDIVDFYGVLSDYAIKHRLPFIDVEISNFLNLDSSEFEKFKQLFLINLFTRFEKVNQVETQKEENLVLDIEI
mgnify:CR=1 FL=1